MMRNTCDKCMHYHLGFSAKYKPDEFLEGKPNSKIWILGLNPKKLKDQKQYEHDLNHTKENLENYFSEPDVHPYFKDFKTVSPVLYSMLGQNKGVATTDIVKCFTDTFPPEGCKTKEKKQILANCRPFLKQQLIQLKPKLIICNGKEASEVIKTIIKPPKKFNTSYVGTFENMEIAVILSGFIGRIDTYAKKRLGLEVENYIKEMSLDIHAQTIDISYYKKPKGNK